MPNFWRWIKVLFNMSRWITPQTSNDESPNKPLTPNERAENLLDTIGATYEYEPLWVEEGQKPDFYCSSTPNFWCEVKSLDRPDEFTSLADAHAELVTRTSGISQKARAFAYISNNFTHRDAKIVSHLLKRAVQRFDDADTPKKVVALIPGDPDYGHFVRFSISSRQYSAVEFHSCVSSSGKYGSPNGILPEPYGQLAQLKFSSGQTIERPARELINSRNDFRVAVVAEPDERHLRIIASSPTGGAKRSNTPERIRDAVSEANSQFKNGTKYRNAPCLLMIFHAGLDVPDDSIILSALYGDLKYEFSPEKPDNGRLIVQGNGAWNQNKNRTTSAIMYIRNEGEPLLIHNYWANQAFSTRSVPL